MNVHSRDRRQWVRYTALHKDALIGWWENGQYRTAAACLKNISPGGVLLVSETLPEEGGSLWLCLAGSAPSSWLETTVMKAIPTSYRQNRIHLAFREPCPDAFFQTAIEALDDGQTIPKPVPAHLPEAVRAAMERMGLGWPCTLAEVHTKYRHQSKTLHPDHGGSADAFTRLYDDYQILKAFYREDVSSAAASAGNTRNKT